MMVSLRRNYIIDTIRNLPLFTPVFPHLPNKEFKKGKKGGKKGTGKKPAGCWTHS
jgi:hypothetical protein